MSESSALTGAQLLRVIDVLAAHMELRSAAAVVCAELGFPEAARWASFASHAEQQLAQAQDNYLLFLASQ